MKEVIKKAAEKVLYIEEVKNSELSIFLTDDAGIRSLNKLYRGVDDSTDVLAFAMREGEDGDLNREILGDVVISLPRAEEQAAIYSHRLEVEIALLVSHGVLHLLGYDHEKEDEFLILQQKQDKILRSLGYNLSESAGLMKGLSV